MVYFVHLGAKPSAGVVPVDAWRNGDLGDALSLPPTLVYLRPSSIRTPYGPLGSSRGRNLGENVGAWNTGVLWDRDQGGENQQNEPVDLPFAGLSLRDSTMAHWPAGVAILM